MVNSLTSLKPDQMLAWVIAIDFLGIIDSPIPTTKDEILNSLKTIAEDGKLSKAQRLEEILRTSGGINWLEILLGVDVPSVTGV